MVRRARGGLRRTAESGASAARAAALVAVLAIAGSAAAGEIPWDGVKVTAEARALADAMTGLREAFRKEPPARVVSAESLARYRLLDVLRRLEQESQYLAAELEAGKGHDETLPVFENLVELVRDAQEDRRRVFVQSTTLERIETARKHLEALDPYYGNLPLPEPVEQGTSPDTE